MTAEIVVTHEMIEAGHEAAGGHRNVSECSIENIYRAMRRLEPSPTAVTVEPQTDDGWDGFGPGGA